MKKHLKISLILNSVIVGLFIFGITTALLDWLWMGIDGKLTPESTNYLSFFTIDSNILLAVASLTLLVFEVLVLLNKRKGIPHWVIVFKYVSVITTSLTMVTTVFVLSPLVGAEFWKLFVNSNLFFHLISPILGIVSLVFFENEEKMNWKVSFLPLIPMGLYAIFYITNVYTHLDNGKVDPNYDFYAFARFGILWTILMVFLMTAFTYGSAILIHYLRGIKQKKSKKQ